MSVLSISSRQKSFIRRITKTSTESVFSPCLIDDLDRRTSLTPTSAQDSAREWFASESDAVGSFIWTCHIINVDPYFIRSRLAKKHRRKNPDEVVMTSRTHRMKISRGKCFPNLHTKVDRTQAAVKVSIE